MSQTVLTSQGTLTLPIEIRRKHNLHPGDVLAVQDEGESIRITKTTSLSELREKNRPFIKNAHSYKQGDGWAAHVHEKYGKA